MAEYSVSHFFSNEGTRNEVRMRVVSVFAEETPGNGIELDASRYTYYIEELSSGDRIFLRRPANLHNGFDFLVCVENHNFAEPGKKRRNYPKHSDILADLLDKKDKCPELYRVIYNLLKEVYHCHDIDSDMIRELITDIGYSAELIIKTVKWLFIEQDIRYWNYSGREMLWSGIPQP